MMKRLALAGGILAVGLLAAQSIAGIVDTKHNLSSVSGNTIRAADGATDEICVFCHTPHNANNAGFSGAPLWNKETPSGTYTMYGTTVAGTTPDSTPNAPSLACLSCHDGASAINSVYNAPGTGMGGGYIQMQGQSSATAYPMPAGSAANLGTDLSDDHPVSIVYTAGKASLRQTTDTLPGTWIVSGTPRTDATVGDLLRNGKVECVSCHDPHTSDNPLFLRTTTQESNLCLGCHNK